MNVCVVGMAGCVVRCAPKVDAGRLFGPACRPRVQDELHLDAAHRLKGVADLDAEATEVYWGGICPLRIRVVVGCLRAEGGVHAVVRLHW